MKSTLVLLLISMLPRSHALSSIAVKSPGVARAPTDSSLQEFDYKTQSKLPWTREGHETWKWKGHDINYIEMGDPDKPPLLLIHGFGASAYHFRHNIPVLARDYHVYAFDMLGFGFSGKPVQGYPAEVWRDQTIDFVQQVIGEPVTLAGNSLGGFTALYAAADAPELVNGCILLNAAGSFRSEAESSSSPPPKWVQKIQTAIQRVAVATSFAYTKQPASIEQVLKQVYPTSPHMVDQDLVEAIQLPSKHPNAAEVFYQVIAKAASRETYVDDLLETVQCPLLLCWGQEDPWIRPQAADRIQALTREADYPVSRVDISAGHCPHDEAPEAVNEAILDFMAETVHV